MYQQLINVGQVASVAFLAGRQLWPLSFLQPGHRHVGHCVCRPAAHNTFSMKAFHSRLHARAGLGIRVNAVQSLFGQAVHADSEDPKIVWQNTTHHATGHVKSRGLPLKSDAIACAMKMVVTSAAPSAGLSTPRKYTAPQ